MTKKKLIAALTVSAMTLSAASPILADDLTPVDSSQPGTEVVVPSNPTTPIEAPTVKPDTPLAPIDSTTPGASGEDTTKPAVPDTPTTPESSETPLTPETPATVPTTPGETQPQNQGTNNNAAATTPTESAPSPSQASQPQGTPQENPVGNVAAAGQHQAVDPIVTTNGQAIVGTQNGQVVLQDGTVTSPEAVSATTNADQTITVTKADGTMTTLPHTGEIKSLLGLLGALLLVPLAGLYKKKWTL